MPPAQAKKDNKKPSVLQNLSGSVRTLGMVRITGLEPARYCYHRHLKPARLPIPPYPHIYFLFDNKNYFNIVSTKSQYLSEKNMRQKTAALKLWRPFETNRKQILKIAGFLPHSLQSRRGLPPQR